MNTIDGSLGRAIHVHELDALGPVLDQLLAESFTSNDDGLQSRVILERNDSEDTWSAMDDVDTKGFDSLPDITEYEFLASSDEGCTTGEGTKDIGDERIEGVSE
jgi:hypothetical protein